MADVIQDKKGKFVSPKDIQLEQLRKQKESLLQHRISENRSKQVQDFWKNTKQQYEDFATYFLPTEDQHATTGSGQDFSGSFSQYQYLAERRIGLGPRLTRMVADDAVRNRFRLESTKTEKINEKLTGEIMDYCEEPNVKFFQHLSDAIYFERTYGISFLVKYYTENDKEYEDLTKPPKKGAKPVAFQAFPPTLMQPIDIWNNKQLGMDPTKWNVRGGLYDPQEIHHERVHVFMSRPVPNRWFGLSVFEPLWDSIISYYQALIFLLRGFSKFGNMATFVKIDSPEALEALFDKYGDLIESYKMNGTFIMKRGDDVVFAPTELGTGLRELIEVWVEDISSGAGIPVPQLMGRVESAGLGNGAYLTAERIYWTTVAKVQDSFSDDVLSIFQNAGFKVEKHRLSWNLAIAKTDQQRYLDEGMKLQNQILEEELRQKQMETLTMMDNYAAIKQGKTPPNQQTSQEEGTSQPSQQPQKKKKSGSKNKEVEKQYEQPEKEVKQTDFVVQAILEERNKLVRKLWGVA